MPPIATKIRTAASDGAAGARRQKPYDRQSGGQRNANKVCARKVLAVLSGGQPTELLKDLLQVGECFAGSGQSAFARQTRSLLKCLTHLFSKVPAAAKLESLSMLVSLFPRSQLRDFGLCFSNSTYAKARNLVRTTTTNLSHIVRPSASTTNIETAPLDDSSVDPHVTSSNVTSRTPDASCLNKRGCQSAGLPSPHPMAVSKKQKMYHQPSLSPKKRKAEDGLSPELYPRKIYKKTHQSAQKQSRKLRQ